MSEKVENEIEEKEGEREMFDHWYHEHPLTLAEARGGDKCYGCVMLFRRGDKCYICSQKCGSDVLLHEDCAEAPRKIRHAMHPQHTLAQQFNNEDVRECSICQSSVWGILYRCTSAECTLVMHIRCAQGSDMMYAAEGDKRTIHHPSHPDHELKLWRRSCSFKCDACGTIGAKGSSYTCTNDACEYWIHERCASLPHTIEREEHHHSLSLSFHVLPQYLRYNYRCDVCIKRLNSKQWIYHCKLCSYIVHLNCGFKKSLPTTREKGIMEFPINDVDVGEDLIGAFLRRQGVDAHTLIPHDQDDVDYEFHHHKLMLVSSSSSSFQEEENGDDDDDEEDYSSRKSELICDGCITPILVKQTSSSSSFSGSSSSKDNYYYYMRCSMRSCKYYLHLACFQLPTQLSSLPLLHEHENDQYSLVLQSGDNRKPWNWQRCSVCDKVTNGLYYDCAKCHGFRVDIKCASMPGTIYHAAHPPHPLNLLSRKDTKIRAFDSCDGCDRLLWFYTNSYACGSCDFIVHVGCTVLPASTTSHRWDKHHPLLLTHDATLNHPGEFCCNECESIMNPKSWMYHCRSCDISIHPRCFPTTSAWYKNIKFGQKYVIAEAHCHTLTFQLLTTKRRCDVCGEDWHESPGFYCASCIFFICFYRCGKRMIEDGNVKAVY